MLDVIQAERSFTPALSKIIGKKDIVTVAIAARSSIETEILSRAPILAPPESAAIIPVKPAIPTAT
jgi:hypothetical protein